MMMSDSAALAVSQTNLMLTPHSNSFAQNFSIPQLNQQSFRCEAGAVGKLLHMFKGRLVITCSCFQWPMLWIHLTSAAMCVTIFAGRNPLAPMHCRNQLTASTAGQLHPGIRPLPPIAPASHAV